jgi:PAS domain S-box-containing protein
MAATKTAAACRTFRELLRRVWIQLPRGETLPDAVWQRRHRFLLGLTWLHAGLIALIGPVLGYRWEVSLSAAFADGMVLHTFAESLAVAFFASVGTWAKRRRNVQATAVAVGLLSSSAFLVHLSGGYIEMHFHFLVMVAFLALYRDWAVYVVCLLHITLHHGVFGALWPDQVYNHPAALSAPWTWTAIHACFVLGIAGASIVAGRFNEEATAELKLLLDSVGDGVFGVDQNSNVTFVNGAAAILLGWDPAAAVGRPLMAILPHCCSDGAFFTAETSPIFVSLREGTAQRGADHIFVRKDGTKLPVDFVSTPVLEGNRADGVVISFRDVTARQQAEQRLRHVSELQTLHDINRTIFESLDVEPMMERLLEKVLASGGFDIGVICLVTFDRPGLEPVAHRGFRDLKNLDKYRQRVRYQSTSIIDEVLATRTIRVVDLRRRDGVRSFRAEGAQSLAVVPLRTEREAFGLIYLARRNPTKFHQSELDLLDTVGLQVGIAIQKARLFEQAAKKSAELETLARINRDLASHLDDRKLLPLISEEAKKTLQFDRATIWLSEPGSLVLVNASLPENQEFRERIGINEGVSGKIVQENRVIAINNVLDDPTVPEHYRELFLRRGYRSSLGIPLRVAGQVIGCLNCLSRRQRDFRPDEIDLMTAFADQAAIAIHNARLYGQSEQAKQGLETANQRLQNLLEDQSNLYADLTPLAQAESIPQLLNKVIDRLMDATGADAASIRFLDPRTEMFYIPAHRGFPEKYVNARRDRVPGRAISVVFETGEPIIAPDIETDPRIIRKSQREAGFRSCAFLPLKMRNEVRGIVQLASRQAGYFNAGREAFLMAIVRQMGIAMENRELFEETNAAKKELERSNSELQQFAYVASHDLQEPLRMVSGYTQLLAKRYQGQLDADADEFISYAVNGANRMQALIQALLDFSSVGSRKTGLTQVDCNEVMHIVLAALRAAVEQSSAVITYDSLPQVRADELQLVQLFQNLISNAIKYQNGGPPNIHVSCKAEGERWMFSVKDNGIGIDPKYADRIFLIFQRLHTQQEYSGTGIGLALCKKIVERHGGKIWVESELGKGCVFRFTLPA